MHMPHILLMTEKLNFFRQKLFQFSPEIFVQKLLKSTLIRLRFLISFSFSFLKIICFISEYVRRLSSQIFNL